MPPQIKPICDAYNTLHLKNKTNELNHPSFLFWYMAEALEINYYHQSCGTHGKEDYFEGDYIIDVKLFEHNIINMINHQKSAD